jgi:hypothetical protein
VDERRRGVMRGLAVAGLAVALLGPAAAGDLGRPDPAQGGLFDSLRPRLVPAELSTTDEEREMHDRFWRFMQLPVGPGRVASLGGKGRPVDPAAAGMGYYRWLMGTEFASARVRYARLADDVKADLGTLPAAFAAACAVAGIDRQRRIAAHGLDDIEPAMIAAAERRAADNAADMSRFATALGWRLDGYAYALDHLLVDAPYEDAVAVDALLGELEPWVDEAARGAFCGG